MARRTGEIQFLVRFCREVRAPSEVWTGGVALGKDEKYVWVGNEAPIEKGQLKMTPASDPNHGYCAKFGWKKPTATLDTWDCGLQRWYVCKY